MFEATHATILRLVARGARRRPARRPRRTASPTRAAYLDAAARPTGVEHVWVEKILEPGEPLRDWPVEGTTGYEFLADVQALFVDPAAEAALTELAGEDRPFAEVAAEAKLEQAETTFAPEVEWLRRLARRPGDRRGRSPRCRSTAPTSSPRRGRVDDADRRGAGGRPAGPARACCSWNATTAARDEFVTRFQQTTGRGDGQGRRGHRVLPLRPAARAQRGRRRPRAVRRARRRRSTPRTASARRASHATCSPRRRTTRSAAPTCAPARRAHRRRQNAGAELVERWHDVTAPLRSEGAPDWAEELFVYQTLVGTWPISRERLEAYLVKALREAKRNTSWIDPNERVGGRGRAGSRPR